MFGKRWVDHGTNTSSTNFSLMGGVVPIFNDSPKLYGYGWTIRVDHNDCCYAKFSNALILTT